MNSILMLQPERLTLIPSHPIMTIPPNTIHRFPHHSCLPCPPYMTHNTINLLLNKSQYIYISVDLNVSLEIIIPKQHLFKLNNYETLYSNTAKCHLYKVVLPGKIFRFRQEEYKSVSEAQLLNLIGDKFLFLGLNTL